MFAKIAEAKVGCGVPKPLGSGAMELISRPMETTGKPGKNTVETVEIHLKNRNIMF